MNGFRICSISPGYLDHAGVAIATARAGGVALLDFEFLKPDRLARGRSNLQNLLRLAGKNSIVGIRVAASQWESWRELSTLLEGRRHWLVLAGWSRESLAQLGPKIAADERRFWLELEHSGQVVEPAQTGFSFDGFLARGSECGGSCGRASAFFLAQALATQSKPFLVQGGIGLQSIAACRVAGAAGVVLEEQLLLTAESSLPEQWQRLVRNIGCGDTTVAGEEVDRPARFAAGPEFAAGRRLSARWTEIWTGEDQPLDLKRASWQQALEETLGWGPPHQCAWPMGQMAGFSRQFAEKFRTTGRVIEAFRRASETGAELCGENAPLKRHSALARSHGTEFPIVQGPMTRVSDRAEFAAAVASAGALPMLALALLRREDVAALLKETADLLGDRPWGVGILGFVPPEVRAGQLAAIMERKPPFALIAGGRPDQAAQLEELGIATYLHVPSPNILSIFLRQGARRFVFEGSECGGHVGPFTSFVLWQQVIDVLLAEAPAGEEGRIHVLFAGGIHDARSAAMVSAMAAPLAAKGIRIGVLMGTAYLFTEEAVARGAIVEQFQQTAIESTYTVRLETGVGHSIRCAPTPFTSEFSETRRRLFTQGLTPASVSGTLESLVMGRSRAASKGLLRLEEGRLLPLDTPAQYERGMYMLGEVAALRKSATTLPALHAEISDGSAQLLEICRLEWGAAEAAHSTPAVPIAIIGASCFLPAAQNPEQYWKNLLDQVNAITEIPPARFDWRLYFDPDPAAEDKIYSRWGGFLGEVEFDPVRYGIPPRSLKSIALSQLLALEAARRAIDDAGLGSGEFDRENTAVIFGNNTTADLFHYYIARSTLPLHTGANRDALDRLPGWTEESFPGLLMNVTAGRVANRLDLGGPNYSVDAACASSLAALQLGVRELETGRSNLAVVAGIDLDQTPYAYLAFSKTRAMSPTGSAKPFDRHADGIVISEGVVCLVIKRLADAERDGDRIYAVIRAVEGSSDGKGLGLTAPRSGGQRRALQRAYRRANVDPGSIGLYEAHGTGTAVGDRTELETIVATLSGAGAPPRSCVIGSAKSLIGHTKAAAGLAGVLKAALALYHRTLPPHAGVEQPLDPLLHAACPVRLIDRPQPWLDGPVPRRAGVSAFGFGGTNFHAVLEEYPEYLKAPAPGARLWPAELFAFSAATPSEVAEDLATLAAALDSGTPSSLRDLAFTCAGLVESSAGRVRLAFVAADRSELRRLLETARAVLAAGKPCSSGPVYYQEGSAEAKPAPPQVAFLFPGQGSQYPGMVREFSLYLPEFRAAWESINSLLPEETHRAIRQVLLPAANSCGASDEALRSQLAATDIAQPALGMVACALLDFVERLGIRPVCVAGHSYGEYAALHAAGVLSREAFLGLSAARGRAMAVAAHRAPGAMAAVNCAREHLRSLLGSWPDIVVANDNGPRQCVISGPREAIEAAVAELKTRRHAATLLPVASAFHSPLMRPAAEPLARAIESTDVSEPLCPVFSNADGKPYPAHPAVIRARLAAQLESPVEFAAQIRAMYQAGARVFLELGPKSVLSNLTSSILEGLPHHAVPLDGQSAQMRGLLTSLAALFTEGLSLRLTALFEGRNAHQVDWRAGAAPSAEWLLDGGRVRHRSEPSGTIAGLPLLTLETQAQVVERMSTAAATADTVEAQTLDAYREYQGTMRQFLERQEQVLMQFLDRLGAPAPVRSEPAAPIQPVPEPPRPRAQLEMAAQPVLRTDPPSARPSHENVTELLIRLVAERTGYAAETFDLDQDLEAELGIDSIKRVEILGGLESKLSDAMARPIRAQMDRLMQLKTLRAIVQAVSEATGSASRAPELAPSCPRFVVRETPAELPDRGALPAGRYVITEDSMGVAGHLVQALRHRGVEASVIPRDALGSMELLRLQMERSLSAGTPVRCVIHLAGLVPQLSGVSLDEWRRESQLETKSLFEIVKLWADTFQPGDTTPCLAVAATLLGGSWARRSTPPCSGLAVAAGAHGILRTLAQEHPNVAAKVIDLDPSLPGEGLARVIVAELSSADSETEVGYPEGRRVVFQVERQDVMPGSPRPWKPSAGWVVLVTGGARGITGHCARRLAAPGVRMIVVGNTPLTDDPQEDISAAARTELRERLVAENGANGHRPRLSEIEDAVRKILQNRERNLVLREMRGRGAEVEYHCADVASEAAFGSVIASAYERFGRIDAVLHGAGIIEDQLLRMKSRASFDRVFDTKADSAYLLLRHLRPEGLRWVALFSSITARLGNRGQADYAAANEVVNRLAWQMAAAWPDTRVSAIDWGPWTGAGMASEGVQRLLVNRGFQLIDIEAGWRFLANELEFGDRTEVEVIAGEAPWKQPVAAARAAGDEFEVTLKGEAAGR